MRAYKNKIKRLRLTEQQVLRIETYLSQHDLNFSEFVIYLIEQTLNQEPIKIKKKIAKPSPKVDPKLLLELGKIGNNINQLAKSLNIIRQDPSHFNQFSFFQCFNTLSEMQLDLHDCLDHLRKQGPSDAH